MKPIITLLLTFCLLASPFTLQSHAAAPAPVPQTGHTSIGKRINRFWLSVMYCATVLTSRYTNSVKGVRYAHS